MNFVAKFMFTASIFGWVLYAAPPLLVTTRLTTGKVRGQHQGIGGEGSPMDSDGYARWGSHSLLCKSGTALSSR